MKRKKLLTLLSSVCLALVLVALLLPACAKDVPTPAPVAPTPAPVVPTPAPEIFQLKFASPLPPPPYTASVIAEWWVQEVENRTNGRVEFQVFHGGTLTKPKEELEAVQSGLADAGFVIPVYYPTKLELASFPFGMPFGPTDHVQVIEVVNEMYNTIPALKGEIEQYNQKPTGFYQAMGDYNIMSSVPLGVVSDFKGVKVGSIGLYHPKMLAAVGAVPVSITAAERYQSMETGVIQGSVLPYDLGCSVRVHEVSKYYVNVNFGASYAGLVTVNSDTFESLPPDIQQIILETGEEARKKLANETTSRLEKAKQDMRDAGLEVIDFPEAEKAKWIGILIDIPADWANNMNAKGKPGTEIMAAYLSLTSKIHQYPRQWMK